MLEPIYYEHKHAYLSLKTLKFGGKKRGKKSLNGGNESSNEIRIMQFNMLANGLLDSFLSPQTIKIFTANGPNELNEKKEYFEKLNVNIKQLFDAKISELSLKELKKYIKKSEGLKEMEYNLKRISDFEIYLLDRLAEEDHPSKRIKNIANGIWKKIQLSLMQGNEKYVPCIDTNNVNSLLWYKLKQSERDKSKCTELSNKDQDKDQDQDQKQKQIQEIIQGIIGSQIKKLNDKNIIPDTVRDIEAMIGIVSNIFSKKYKDYKSDVEKIQANNKSIEQDIESYLQARFNAFKKMVQQYDPWIICLEEDDYDNYFNNDDYFMKNYGFARCKKDPSTAKTLITKKTGSKLLWSLSENYVKNACPDGATVLFKKSKFNDPDPQDKPNVAKKNKSPFVIKELQTVDDNQTIYVLCAHLESGFEDYKKEEIRIQDINEILEDPMFEKIENNPDAELIICMDGNTPFLGKERFYDYYGTGNVVEGGKTGEYIESKIVIDGSPISKNTAMHRLMDKLSLDQTNVSVEKPTQMYSVNRLRGPDSNQLAKAFEYEYHCIDHCFYKGNKYELVKTSLPRMHDNGHDYEHLLPNFNLDLKDIEWENFSKINPDKFISISDHLPLCVSLRYKK